MKRVLGRQSPGQMDSTGNEHRENEENIKTNPTTQDAKEIRGHQFQTRINASPGYWLCTLLPLAYMSNNIRYSKSASSFEYQMTTILSLGLCFQSVYIFACLSRAPKKQFKFVLYIIPGACTSVLIRYVLKQSVSVSAFWGCGTTLLYNFVYYKLLTALPKSFTYGEASIASEGLILFLVNAALKIPVFVKDPPQNDMSQMNAIMISALMCLIVALFILYAVKFMRKPIFFYPLMVGLVISVCTIPVTSNLPVITLWHFITGDLRKVFFVIFYLGLVGVTIVTVSWILGKEEEASTIVRKLFHVLTVLVYIPGLLYQCTFLYIASGVALALISVIETIRVIKVPPLFSVLEKSFSLLADEKDSGIVALTPFYLLIGCSLPMWISPLSCVTTDNALNNCLPLMSGVLTVGIGDTAASVVGSLLGKHRLPNSNKSIEGTVANILAQTTVVCLLIYCGYIHVDLFAKCSTGLAIILSSFTEAFTDQVDNLVLPLIFYITWVIIY